MVDTEPDKYPLNNPESIGCAMVVDATKTNSAADCVGIAGYAGKVASVEQMDVAIYAIKDKVKE